MFTTKASDIGTSCSGLRQHRKLPASASVFISYFGASRHAVSVQIDFVAYVSSYLGSFDALLVRSLCVPCAFPSLHMQDSFTKSGFPLLICIRVESMTSPIVITKGKNAFLHTNLD